MTIIYDFEHANAMKQKNDYDYAVYQNYKNGKYKATHKRVKDAEFFLLPKIFIYCNHVCIVTGEQVRGGRAYVEHCRSFSVSIDRKNKIIFLNKKGSLDSCQSKPNP